MSIVSEMDDKMGRYACFPARVVHLGDFPGGCGQMGVLGAVRSHF